MLSLVIAMACSALAGYVAGMLMKMNGVWYFYVILGLIGGLVGDLAFSLIGLKSVSPIGNIIVSVIGACIVVFLYRKLKK